MFSLPSLSKILLFLVMMGGYWLLRRWWQSFMRNRVNPQQDSSSGNRKTQSESSPDPAKQVSQTMQECRHCHVFIPSDAGPCERPNCPRS